MKINPCKNLPFGQNSQKKISEDKNSKGTKNWELGVLTYAVACAVFPHNYEKMVDKIDINFKNLPLQDKAKNIVKAAIPFFGYPLLVLLGLKLAVEGYKKIANKETN